jgi:hypothetical protein
MWESRDMIRGREKMKEGGVWGRKVLTFSPHHVSQVIHELVCAMLFLHN